MLLLPSKLWLVGLPEINPNDSENKFAINFLVRLFLYYWPIIWLLLYVIVILPFVIFPWGTGAVQVFLVSYLIGAGISIGDGIIEMLTHLSPVRRISFSRIPASTTFLAIGDNGMKFGLWRIALIVSVGLVFALISSFL